MPCCFSLDASPISLRHAADFRFFAFFRHAADIADDDAFRHAAITFYFAVITPFRYADAAADATITLYTRVLRYDADADIDIILLIFRC